MAMTETPSVAPVAVAAANNETSYVDWPAIFAGTVLATAISFVLLTFGSAVGLSLTSAYEGEGISFLGFAIAAGLWILWVQISAFFAGGYLTGRLRRRKFDATEAESDLRDGSHGLVVWAVGVLLGGAMALSGIGAVASTATSAATTVVAGTAAGAGAIAADQLNPSDLMIDRFLRGDAGPDNTAEDTRAQVGRVLLNALGSDTLDAADRDYLTSVIASRTGIPPEEAATRVDQLWAQAQQIEATARDAADRARRIGLIVAFLTAASLAVSGAAAYYAAVLGGNHRDKQVFFEDWSRPW
jgi:hypothetical protein